MPRRRARVGAAGARPVRADAGRAGRSRASASQEERDAWWAPSVRPTSAGGRRDPGWRGDLANGRGGPLGPVAVGGGLGHRRPWERSRWTDERLAAERARTLRRLGRWAEAAEAWQAAAAAGGGLGAIAWIEVAKLREHRLDDPGGALAATRAAWRLLERLRADWAGAPAPRGGPPAARGAPGGPASAAVRRGPATGALSRGRSPPCIRRRRRRAVRDAEHARALEDQRAAAAPSRRSGSGPIRAAQ